MGLWNPPTHCAPCGLLHHAKGALLSAVGLHMYNLWGVVKQSKAWGTQSGAWGLYTHQTRCAPCGPLYHTRGALLSAVGLQKYNLWG